MIKYIFNAVCFLFFFRFVSFCFVLLCFVLFCFVYWFFFSFTSTNLYDETWQHLCLTWENTQGVTIKSKCSVSKLVN